MKSRKSILWFITGMVVVLNMLLGYLYFGELYGMFADDGDAERGKFEGMFATIFYTLVLIFPVMLVALGAFFAVLGALIPFGGRIFEKRFLLLLPPIAIVLNLAYGGFLGYAIWEFYKYEDSRVDISEVPLNDELDCEAVQTGWFKTQYMLIERSEYVQREVDLERNKTAYFDIIWRDSCEYWLINRDPDIFTPDTARIIITDITDTSYICYVGYVGLSNEDMYEIEVSFADSTDFQ